MVDVVKAKTRAALLEGTYKPLYTLYSEDMEGSKGYFTQVCRTYWREHVIPNGLDEARRAVHGRLPALPFAFAG